MSGTKLQIVKQMSCKYLFLNNKIDAYILRNTIGTALTGKSAWYSLVVLQIYFADLFCDPAEVDSTEFCRADGNHAIFGYSPNHPEVSVIAWLDSR